METVTATVLQWFGSEALLRWGTLLAIGATGFAVSLALLLLVNSAMDPVRRRARQLGAPVGEPLGAAPRFNEGSLGGLNRYLLPQSDEERSQMRRRLTVAGYRAKNAVVLFYTAKAVLALGLPLLVLLAVSLLSAGLAFHLLLIGAMASSVAGLFLPNLWVQRVARERQQRLARGLSDALDLLVVCTEAGYGLTQALQRVSEELGLIHPELARELAQTTVEMRAGLERREALHNLVERNGLEELRGLVVLLVQSMRFGTGINDTLRVYAEEFREKRMQRAEERAATVQAKMIFPLVLCMLPAFFIVVVGPAVISLLEVFRQM